MLAFWIHGWQNGQAVVGDLCSRVSSSELCRKPKASRTIGRKLLDHGPGHADQCPTGRCVDRIQVIDATRIATKALRSLVRR